MGKKLNAGLAASLLASAIAGGMLAKDDAETPEPAKPAETQRTDALPKEQAPPVAEVRSSTSLFAKMAVAPDADTNGPDEYQRYLESLLSQTLNGDVDSMEKLKYICDDDYEEVEKRLKLTPQFHLKLLAAFRFVNAVEGLGPNPDEYAYTKILSAFNITTVFLDGEMIKTADFLKDQEFIKMTGHTQDSLRAIMIGALKRVPYPNEKIMDTLGITQEEISSPSQQ